MTTRTVGLTGAARAAGRAGKAGKARAAGTAGAAEARAGAVLATYERQADGLFTYCLSVLCEHDAAADALREVRELARRHGDRLAEPGLLRAWLFSLARYCCLRRLAGGGEAGPGAVACAEAEAGWATGAETGWAPGADAGRASGAEAGETEAARRRRALSSLAWPEAAGTDPEQREALELSVRHRLTPLEVAAVLGLPFGRTRELLAGAEAEVARTRAALLVLGDGGCPELDRLGGALRRELVRHVVDCPTCRGTAERVAASEAAEGVAGLSGPSGLSLLRAPGVAAPLVAAPLLEPGPRFDQGGFPRHRAPDAGRGLAVRRRVVTTGVLAAVLAAPVIALWAGHRGDGGSGSAATVSAVRVDEAGRSAGQRPAVGGPAEPGASGMPGMELAGGVGGGGASGGGAETLLPGLPRLTVQGPAVPVPVHDATPLTSQALAATPAPAPAADRASAPGTGEPASAGLLTVEAAEYGSRTILTLTNSGTAEIRWHAATDADWLRLSRDSGTLAPGQRITVIVTVDEDQAPTTHWTARIALPPSQAVVTLEGGPHNRGGSASSPATPTPTTPSPTATPTTPATASPSSSPSPSPTDTPTATPGPGASPHLPATTTTPPPNH
ncbi:hypothetical protein ACFRAR_17490 [Kitasatospora sp. NPDC056651]|uniref:BACON domain-containing protein n=1 Tax=Kitasatospora sp. NPDC056651 TaxID=3345892 RepID=UPI003679657C